MSMNNMLQGSLGSSLEADCYRTQKEYLCSIKKECERKWRKLREKLTYSFNFFSEVRGKVIF